MNISETDSSARPSEWLSLWNQGDSTISFKNSTKQNRGEIKEDNFNQEKNFPPELKSYSRLANWKRWLDIHKEQQDKLSNTLKRPPQCLLMNMNLNNLYVNQQKQLITDASEFKFSDKHRGHPCFWEMEGGAHGDGEKLEIYRPIQKRYDRSRPVPEVNCCSQPKEVEYVGVPDVIMKEKGLLGEQCLPHPKLKWDTSYYVNRKKESLRTKLDLFQEHMPQSETLAVVGCKMIPNESRTVNFDLGNVLEISDASSNESHISMEYLESVRDIITVSIGDDIVDKWSNFWTIYFGDSLTNELYEKVLNIENSSDCCVRYYWELVLPSFINSSLPLKVARNIETFFFDKNDGVILPKSSEKLSFYFDSRRVGVFCEQWKLYLSKAPDEEECITIELQAVAIEKPEIEGNLKRIDSYIESCTRHNIVSKTVKEILERTRPERPLQLPYDWMFFEEQIFIFNNPDLYYDSKSVYSLRELYKRVSEGPWDFSVQTLRKRLSEKALQEDVSETISEFTATICNLVKPKLKFSLTNEKRKSVCELLSCFINILEKESDSLKCILKIPLRLSSSLSLRDESKISVRTPRSSKLKSKSGRKTKRKSHTSSSFTDEKTLQGESQFRETFDIRASGVPEEKLEEKIKKQEYLDALYMKTYHHLSVTIDSISAVIDSFDTHKVKGAL
ncbi:MYCBP-associated protein-like [Macrosteles quadrilineatus]|uniref:MYCBP-associated protein-like n=1 Tax=Macrosteles quadrilineatus TaxID=74068 RepID=UPI0023E271AC|nr:MYCBP-associated protein-like [Macrosteles quadrilineatus]